MAETRKLAVIMFADIHGYTALMQTDEALAVSLIAKFKEVLSEFIAEYKGEIVQFYGDGCLATFDSAVNATACSEALQNVFRQTPEVPVRIGLHAGDVLYREGNIFGDAVNIASRIESMGTPGSVLVSSTIRNQVKNHKKFELISLGRFGFKNVEGKMTVYALANEGLVVPKKTFNYRKTYSHTPS